MIIDCQTCPVRGTHCAECMVPVVARQWLADPGVGPRNGVGRDRRSTRAAGGPMAGGHRGAGYEKDVGLDDVGADDVDADEGELDDAEWEAVDVFVRAGMINTLVAAGTTATVAAQGAWSRVS